MCYTLIVDSCKVYHESKSIIISHTKLGASTLINGTFIFEEYMLNEYYFTILLALEKMCSRNIVPVIKAHNGGAWR